MAIWTTFGAGVCEDCEYILLWIAGKMSGLFEPKYGTVSGLFAASVKRQKPEPNTIWKSTNGLVGYPIGVANSLFQQFPEVVLFINSSPT